MNRIRRALVTGASRGLGEEFARQLAARGADLVLVARSEEELASLARELEQRHGRTVEVVAADLIEADGRARVEARLADDGAPIDLLVNNAGFGAYGEFAGLPLDRQMDMVQLNVTALVRLTRVLLPSLIAGSRGGVINVASTAAFQPDPHGAVYGATKAFVLSFTEALHEEVRGTGVRVLAAAPGFTRTGFQEAADVSLRALPSAIQMMPGPVVEQVLKDFTRGRATSVPGLPHALGARGASLTPSAISRKLSGLVHRRFTAGG